MLYIYILFYIFIFILYFIDLISMLFDINIKENFLSHTYIHISIK